MNTRAILGALTMAAVILNSPAMGQQGQGGKRIVGWRTDTTGCYPGTTPPLRWSKENNVAWKSPMPSWTDSSPVIVGGRIFTVAETNTILCVDKKDGRILWSHQNEVEKLCDLKALGTAAESRKSALLKEAAALRQDLEAVSNQLVKIWEVDVGGGEVDDVGKREAEDKVLKEKARRIEDRIGSLQKMADATGPVRSKGALKEVGYSCATPVSDGSVVFTVFGNGLGVLFDLEGNRIWTQFLRPVLMGYGQSMSPALADDVLGIHIDEDFFGVDLKTGKILWQARETQHQGSPVAIKAGDAWVFLGTDGSVWRAKDGQLITKLGFPSLDRFGTPIVRGNSAWWLGEDRFICQAVVENKDGAISVKHTSKNIPGGTYYASGVVFDGYLALWDNVDYKLDKKKLNITDFASGKKLATTNLTVAGWAYPSPAYAGGFLYVSGDKGETAVLMLNRSGGEVSLVEVARNSLESFRSSPVFEEDRMYIRSMGNLWCIKTSEEDKAEAARLLAGRK